MIPPHPDMLKDATYYRDAFRIIRRALDGQNTEPGHDAALSALDFILEGYGQDGDALLALGDDRYLHDLATYDESVSALRGWLQSDPGTVAPQIMRIHLQYLETAPRLFRRIAAEMAAGKRNAANGPHTIL